VRAVFRACGAVSVLGLCGIAQSPASDDPVARLVAADAARLLRAADPLLRGEAALVVAEASALGSHDHLLAAAADPAPAARHRAIVALGLQATPGTATVLDQLLADGDTRLEPAGIAAAFALGLLPPDHAPAVVSQVLTSFLHGNLRRQQAPLLALLLGLSRHAARQPRAALLRLYDDDSTRDPQVRAQLLLLLLRSGHDFGARRLGRLLERGATEERTTLLRWLASESLADEAGLLPLVERAAKAGEPAQRAAALAALTRRRHLPALELAARAMRSDDAAECAQGMRSVLAIGGAGMRRALERHLLDEREPVRKAALLSSFEAPPSAELLDQAAALAIDPAQPFVLRTAAATLLARSQPGRAATILRDLFRATPDAGSLPSLAAQLLRDGGEPPPLDRLLDGGTELCHHPARWQALLAAGHPAAVRQLLAALRGDAPSPATAMALQLWRRVRVLAVPRPAVGSPPAALLELLGD
jgi:hypothetical protein